MSDIKPIPEFISHKKLKGFLSKAPKERKFLNEANIELNQSKENLDDLLQHWLKSSENLIGQLKKDESYITNEKRSKSLLSLGAMEAHINMAIQALKAYESDPE